MDLFQFIWERTWFTNQGVFSRRGGCMLYCVDYKLRDWKPEGKKVWDVIKIPENRSVFLLSQTYRQIGVHKIPSSSVNEHKNHQPIPFNIHTLSNSNHIVGSAL